MASNKILNFVAAPNSLSISNPLPIPVIRNVLLKIFLNRILGCLIFLCFIAYFRMKISRLISKAAVVCRRKMKEIIIFVF